MTERDAVKLCVLFCQGEALPNQTELKEAVKTILHTLKEQNRVLVGIEDSINKMTIRLEAFDEPS